MMTHTYLFHRSNNQSIATDKTICIDSQVTTRVRERMVEEKKTRERNQLK